METVVAKSGNDNYFITLASSYPFSKTGNLIQGAESVPAAVMEKVEEVTTLLSELPANVMLEVVGAVVSARFEVLLFCLMSQHSVAIHKASAKIQCAMLARTSAHDLLLMPDSALLCRTNFLAR